MVLTNAKDGDFSQQEMIVLEDRFDSLKKSYIKTFSNSKLKVNEVRDIAKWYMEKSTDDKK